MKYCPVITTCLIVAVTSPATAEPLLFVHVEANKEVIAPGDSVDWHIWAELVNPEREVMTVLSAIDLSIFFEDQDDIVLSNYQLTSSFQSNFGFHNGNRDTNNSITGIYGYNHIAPLNNPGGPDRSNPISLYTFTMTQDGTLGTSGYQPIIRFDEQPIGYFFEEPFHVPIRYTPNFSGGDVRYVIEYDTVYLVPAPATALLALTAIAPLRRRSR